MKLTIATLAQLIAAGVTVSAYGLALVEWGRTESTSQGSVRRAIAIWTAAALGLLGVMALLEGLSFGFGASWGFLSSAAFLLVLQAIGLPFLLAVGCHWAQGFQNNPFALTSRPWRRWPWGWMILAYAAMLGWTALLAWRWPHLVPTSTAKLLGLNLMPAALQWPFVIALLTLMPILEEALYRHYLLYRLATRLGGGRAAMVGSIVVTSLLWSVGHGHTIDPYWLKLLQTFVLGGILGLTAWKRGLEAALALHWTYNLSLIPIINLLYRA